MGAIARHVRRLVRPARLDAGRRTRPLSDWWGFDRGTPVDRYYIEKFLDEHRDLIRGRVLEVKDNGYTARYGKGVTRSDVIDVDATTLTVGFNNPGAHQSFLGGGNDEILRQVLIEQIGQAWRIEAIVDPSAQPGEAPPRITKPAVETGGQPTPPPPPGPPAAVSDADADPDDPDADDQGLDGAALLERELGASVIEEIKHD